MPDAPLIDAHQHFWLYTPQEYDWIDDSMAAIRRDFRPEDLQKELQRCGLTGSVTVQARQTLIETFWLLDLAGRNPQIKGVVGWVPLTAPHARYLLGEVSTNRLLKGVRHVIQGEPDDRFILREDFNTGIALLKDLGLVYDILILERHLPQTIQFVDRHPDQVFVLDHIAKARIASAELEPWAKNIRELARRPNVHCKLSGMVTEANHRTWTPQSLKPYFDVVLEAFTPARLMFGSDWPVCLVAAKYERWFSVVQDWISPLSGSDRSAILGATATRVYKL